MRKYQTDLEQRVLRLLYDVTTSPANDGKTGARFDTVYLGTIGFSLRATRDALAALVKDRLVTRTNQNEYRLTDKGLCTARQAA